jgi:hypothetical protein
MSVTRPDGTRIASAKRFAESARAANSRFKIRPGWIGTIVDALSNTRLPSVIIHYLDVAGVSLFESKADAPAVIDGHRPLSGAVAFELVQADTFQGAPATKKPQTLTQYCRIKLQS